MTIQLSDLAPVTVGTGKKVHAATFYEVKRGRHTSKVYNHLCGSGDSSFIHNRRQASVRIDPYSTLNDVDCQHCLKAIKVIKSKEGAK